MPLLGCELCPFVNSSTISKVPSVIAIPDEAVNTTSLVLFMLIRSQCRRFASVSVFGIWYCLALPTAEFSLPHRSLTAKSCLLLSTEGFFSILSIFGSYPCSLYVYSHFRLRPRPSVDVVPWPPLRFFVTISDHLTKSSTLAPLVSRSLSSKSGSPT